MASHETSRVSTGAVATRPQSGVGQLGSQGVTNETLKYGDVVTIIGNPGRVAEDHRIRMLSLRRKSDNFGWGQRPGEVVN